MKLLFIGSVFPKDRVGWYINNSTNLDFAANALQWSLIAGLNNFFDINIISIPSLKLKNNRLLSTYKFSTNTDNNYVIGYLNIPGGKQFQASQKALNLMRRIIFDYDVIFVASFGTSCLRIAYHLKKKYPHVKVILLVTDLPQYMSPSQNILYRCGKKIDFEFIKKYLESVDGFVLLSKYMNVKVNKRNKPFTIIEGVFDVEDEKNVYKSSMFFDSSYKNLLYTGTLNKRYGIQMLVDAFMLIKNPEVKLHICGNGDSVDYIVNCIKKDSRITYWGMRSRNEIIQMQQKAFLLINPRTAEGEYTKYSFPSKTMEYLASGTPTLLYKLPGIPEEYYQYCFIIDNIGAESLAQRMEEILELNMDYLKNVGKNARNFILTQKNPLCQCNKIVELINKL